MKYIFLTENFYNDYKSCEEIEKKLTRPYIQVCIEVDGKVFAIPLRSHIKHPNVLWTDKENQCGLDFSKAVLSSDHDALKKAGQDFIKRVIATIILLLLPLFLQLVFGIFFPKEKIPDICVVDN